MSDDFKKIADPPAKRRIQIDYRARFPGRDVSKT